MHLDDWEKLAHDIICVCKHGSVGGNVNTAEVRRVANFLRNAKIPAARKLPALPLPPVPNAIPDLPKLPGIKPREIPKLPSLPKAPQ